MKKLAGIIIPSILFMVFLAACAPPVAPPGPIDDGLGTDIDDDDDLVATDDTLPTVEAAAQTTLQNLPTLKVQLPASLRADNAAARRARASGRAIGDTAELNIDTLPSLKSQAWFDLQNSGNGGFMKMINGAFDYLKSYSATNTVPVNTEFSLPIGDEQLISIFGMPTEMSGFFSITNKFKIVGDQASDMKLYMRATMTSSSSAAPNPDMPEGGMSATIDVRFDIKYDGLTDKTIDMYFLISQTMGAESMNMPLYAFYDSKTGAVSMAQSWDNYISLQESKTDPTTGAMSSINYYNNGSQSANIQVAYGDDFAGGIASMNQYTYEGETRGYFWGEYYNQYGELLRRDNGENTLWTPVYDESYYTNLKDKGLSSAPETLTTKQKYEWTSEDLGPSGWKYTSSSITQISTAPGVWVNDSKNEYVYSYDNSGYYSGDTQNYYRWIGGAWVLQAGGSGNNYYGWNYMYKADSTPGVWTGGDSIYYWKTSSSSYDQAQGGWEYTVEFYKGYTVPSPITRFGKNYYMSYEYPLRQLLPLSASYANTFKLIQKETYRNSYTWTDWEGNEQVNEYVQYEYFLNKNDRDVIDAGGTVSTDDDVPGSDGINDVEALPVSYDDGIDVRLDKLSNYDMYYWNNGESYKVKADFFRTTGSIPEYFSAPSTAAIDMVDTQLNALMDSAYTTGISAYQAKIDIAIAGPVVGIFE